MEIKVQCVGMKKLVEQVKKGQGSMVDMSPFWQSVGMYMVKRTMRCFDKEQSPDGVKWKPLSKARIKQRNKRHKGGTMKILSDTGALRRSIAYKAFQSRVIFGSVLAYAANHQFGGTVPARPYLGVTEDDKQKVLTMMKTYLKRNLT